MRGRCRVAALACFLLTFPGAPAPAGAQAATLRMGSSLIPPSLVAVLPSDTLEQGFFRRYGLHVPTPTNPFHFVARREAGTTTQGLAGKSVAVSGLGALSYHIPRIVPQENGVDPEKVR